MADNPDPANPDNPDPNPNPDPAPAGEFKWKDKLSADFANSPTIKLFPDTKEGFNNAVKSHLELQKLMGHDKVPIPKGKDDVAALTIFRKAMGVPEKPEGYNLPDAQIPDTMKGLTFDKKAFSETVHKYDLSPAAAKGLWDSYVEMSKQGYATTLKAQEEKVTGLVNQLRQEWGDAYQTKTELGQMVINKFSDDKEMSDFITAMMVSDPRGVKFLAKIGEQFAENKVGDFKYQRHSLTPQEAQTELDQIRRDANHPYNNEKASQAERQRAIDHVNSLIAISKKPTG